MPLLNDAYEPFVFMDKSTVPDGFGGYKRTWTEGARFPAIANVPQSTIATIADQMTERINCTVTTSKTVTLDKFDVIKRLSDGQVFRILSSGADNATPPSASLDMRVVSAEKWVVPDDNE